MDELTRLNIANMTRLTAQEPIGTIDIGAYFQIRTDIANVFTDPDASRKLPYGAVSLSMSIPYDLANIDRPSTEAMSEHFTTSMVGILLIVAIIAGPLGSALNALGESLKLQKELGSLDLQGALNDVPWQDHLSGFDLETGWSALKTPEDCRSKLVCELHNSLINQSKHTLRMIKTLAPLVSVSREYQGAARTGLMGKDCARIYPQCKMTGLQYLSNLPQS